MKFNLIIDSNLELIETPVWDKRLSCLYWTDLFSGDVHEFTPADKKDKAYPTGKMIGAAIPTSDPNVILCSLENGLHLLNKESGKITFLVNPEPGRDENRFNDTRVDAAGRVLMSSVSKKYGTPDYKQDMHGGFYMIDTDGSVKIIEKEINQYNAIVWNKDNTKMFVVDTYNECLMVYPYDLAKGPTGVGSVAIRFGELGMPDGMSIDSEDNLYVCHWTKQVSVWSPEYQRIKTIALPIEYACCTGFGGDDMKDLYLATSKYCYSEEQLKANPGAGGMFVARNDIAGKADNFYIIR